MPDIPKLPTLAQAVAEIEAQCLRPCEETLENARRSIRDCEMKISTELYTGEATAREESAEIDCESTRFDFLTLFGETFLVPYVKWVDRVVPFLSQLARQRRRHYAAMAAGSGGVSVDHQNDAASEKLPDLQFINDFDENDGTGDSFGSSGVDFQSPTAVVGLLQRFYAKCPRDYAECHVADYVPDILRVHVLYALVLWNPFAKLNSRVKFADTELVQLLRTHVAIGDIPGVELLLPQLPEAVYNHVARVLEASAFAACKSGEVASILSYFENLSEIEQEMESLCPCTLSKQVVRNKTGILL